MLKAGDGSGSVNQPVAFTQFAYDATDITSRGGEITSTDTNIGMRLGSVASLSELSGFRLDDRRHQFDVGKTTTQSFGQTQNSIENTGGTVYDCYPSQGGLIVLTLQFKRKTFPYRWISPSICPRCNRLWNMANRRPSDCFSRFRPR